MDERVQSQTKTIQENVLKVNLPMEENYKFLWQKTKLAFQHVWKHYQGTFDWVLKVDDDSFVIMENLRIYLHNKGGEKYYCSAAGGYNSGGPGYILSSENLEKFIRSLNMPGCSKGNVGAEDIEVARCLRLVSIKTADTRDEKNRFRFSPFEPIHTLHAKKLLPKKYNWWWGFTAFPIQEGFECCSDTVISFHYISPDLMRVMQYLIYYASPFGGRQIWDNDGSGMINDDQ